MDCECMVGGTADGMEKEEEEEEEEEERVLQEASVEGSTSPLITRYSPIRVGPQTRRRTPPPPSTSTRCHPSRLAPFISLASTRPPPEPLHLQYRHNRRHKPGPYHDKMHPEPGVYWATLPLPPHPPTHSDTPPRERSSAPSPRGPVAGGAASRGQSSSSTDALTLAVIENMSLKQLANVCTVMPRRGGHIIATYSVCPETCKEILDGIVLAVDVVAEITFFPKSETTLLPPGATFISEETSPLIRRFDSLDGIVSFQALHEELLASYARNDHPKDIPRKRPAKRIVALCKASIVWNKNGIVIAALPKSGLKTLDHLIAASQDLTGWPLKDDAYLSKDDSDASETDNREQLFVSEFVEAFSKSQDVLSFRGVNDGQEGCESELRRRTIPCVHAPRFTSSFVTCEGCENCKGLGTSSAVGTANKDLVTLKKLEERNPGIMQKIIIGGNARVNIERGFLRCNWPQFQIAEQYGDVPVPAIEYPNIKFSHWRIFEHWSNVVSMAARSPGWALVLAACMYALAKTPDDAATAVYSAQRTLIDAPEQTGALEVWKGINSVWETMGRDIALYVAVHIEKHYQAYFELWENDAEARAKREKYCGELEAGVCKRAFETESARWRFGTEVRILKTELGMSSRALIPFQGLGGGITWKDEGYGFYRKTFKDDLDASKTPKLPNTSC
ncbi:hypothetical protein FN846DRAFT_997991 [Sphaerosporella brunnea]|uniref:Uncharacterized protein n=1 Tax=Sphaerosporella brunnea TaxID=1250544 RepID=A0A5J5F5S9_9PEZI|nr:hypothetical protein FN846DRAFT_997991 [Sphaerosporella brunnea]